MITIARIYDHFNSAKGSKDRGECAILVDRLWPRGLSKDNVKMDLWMKEIAPTDKLRKWFSHDLTKWEQFKSRYEQEVYKDERKLKLFKKIKRIEEEKGSVVLLYSAKDREHNNAVALMELLSRSER